MPYVSGKVWWTTDLQTWHEEDVPNLHYLSVHESSWLLGGTHGTNDEDVNPQLTSPFGN